ncbi:MAG: ribose 1,5-bisphosphate isomerase, partial [Thermoplasmatota archaeon]
MKEEKMEGLSLEEIADKIKSMEIRGAAKIGRAAARGLKNSVSRYDQEDIGELKELIREGKKRLKSTRPTAVSLQNAIRYVLKGSSKDVEERKRMVINRADEFIYKSINAGEKIAEYGGRRIRDGDIILTHCNSSMALG